MSPLEESIEKRRKFVDLLHVIRQRYNAVPIFADLRRYLRDIGMSCDMQIDPLDMTTISIMDPDGRIYTATDMGNSRVTTLKLLLDVIDRYSEEIERDVRRLQPENPPLEVSKEHGSDAWYESMIRQMLHRGGVCLWSKTPIKVRAPANVTAGANVTIVSRGPFSRTKFGGWNIAGDLSAPVYAVPPEAPAPIGERNIRATLTGGTIEEPEFTITEEPTRTFEKYITLRAAERLLSGKEIGGWCSTPEALAHQLWQKNLAGDLEWRDGKVVPRSKLAEKDPSIVALNQKAHEMATRKPVSIFVQEQSEWADDL